MKPEEIAKRIGELDEKARYNRDNIPLIDCLENEEKEEYKKLKDLWDKI